MLLVMTAAEYGTDDLVPALAKLPSEHLAAAADYAFEHGAETLCHACDTLLNDN